PESRFTGRARYGHQPDLRAGGRPRGAPAHDAARGHAAHHRAAGGAGRAHPGRQPPAQPGHLFVTTWMEPQAETLMAECLGKNMIDKDEYPQTAEIES